MKTHTRIAIAGFVALGLAGCRADTPSIDYAQDDCPCFDPADMVTVARYGDGTFSVDVYGPGGELETTVHLPADAKVSDIFPETGKGE